MLRKDQIVANISTANKFEALELLVEALVRGHYIPVSLHHKVLDALIRSERSRPSGQPGDLALPEAAVEALPADVEALGLAPQGMDFGASDGSLARVILLTLRSGSGSEGWSDCGMLAKTIGGAPSLVEALATSHSSADAHNKLRIFSAQTM